MKKTLTALVCTAALTLALAGCGNGGGKSDPPALTADTDFEALVSERVTEQEWNAAFSNEAFAGCTVREQRYDGGLVSETAIKSLFYKKTDEGHDFAYFSSMAYGTEVNVTIYFSVTESGVTMYRSTDGVQYSYNTLSRDSDADTVESVENWEASFRSHVWDLTGKFSYFTYNDTLGAYVYEGDTMTTETKPGDGGPGAPSRMTVKFADGKACYFYVVGGGIGEVEYCCYDFGKYSVERPANAEPSE